MSSSYLDQTCMFFHIPYKKSSYKEWVLTLYYNYCNYMIPKLYSFIRSLSFAKSHLLSFLLQFTRLFAHVSDLLTPQSHTHASTCARA